MAKYRATSAARPVWLQQHYDYLSLFCSGQLVTRDRGEHKREETGLPRCVCRPVEFFFFPFRLVFASDSCHSHVNLSVVSGPTCQRRTHWRKRNAKLLLISLGSGTHTALPISSDIHREQLLNVGCVQFPSNF